ncbi:MAG: segregation/condensation protein A [Anaerohalosphaeraceae bacterium]|nr:segregation/condensation protein A [Anaerohalosphaeraceae bacterium]
MTDYKINLDVFSGPLDLLLYLVRKEEVEIYDIPIARVTQEYIRYIEMLKMFDMELAGDFLVMAASLMEIKSAMLLPKDDVDAIEQDEMFDPRNDLIRTLLEYKKFKDAAGLLRAEAQEQEQKYSRSDYILAKLKPDAEPELDMEQIGVWDLLEAFDTIMKATGRMVYDVSHITDDTPIDLYQIEVLARLQLDGPMSLERIFEGRKNKLVMIGLFLSILELAREKLVTAEQEKPDMPIYLRALTDVPAAEAVQEAIFSQQELEAENQGRDEPEIAIEELPAEKQRTRDAEKIRYEDN